MQPRVVTIGIRRIIGRIGKNLTRRILLGFYAVTLAAVGMFGWVVLKNSFGGQANKSGHELDCVFLRMLCRIKVVA
jgi:hypothetical protein